MKVFWLKRIIYYVVPLLVVLLVGASFFDQRILFWNTSFADFGMWLLLVILWVKPLSVLIGRYFSTQKYIYWFKRFLSKIILWRKELWILVFWIFFIHGIFVFIIYSSNLSALLEFSMLLGIISLVALLIGAITSNMWSMKFLRHYWKTVQSVSYIAIITGMIHATFFWMEGAIGWLILYLILKIWELMIMKKRKSFWLYFFVLSLMYSLYILFTI